MDTSSSASARPSAASLKPGLTVFKSDPAWGVNAAYKSPTTGHAVFLETRVGPLKPKVYREAYPNEPQNEMDTRLVDDNGFTFMLVIGGDKLLEPTWGADLKSGEPMRPKTAAASEAQFQLAREAGIAFKGAAAPELADHVVHLSNATRTVPSELKEFTARSTTKIHEAINKGLVTDLDTIGYHYLEADSYNECIVGCAGYHTSVWGWDGTYDFTTSSWIGWSSIVSCNHGDCANSGNVSYNGQSGYSGNTYGGWYSSPQALSAIWSEEPLSSLSVTAGHGCSTGYNWYTPPGHECNDDSAYEMWQVNDSYKNVGYGNTNGKGNASNFSWTSAGSGCGFAGWYSCSYSCACGNSVQCHGDFNSPPSPH